MAAPSLLAIVGPTASGKSALAMRIAKDFNGEIISADSWQVYSGFDIGTAKPAQADQQQIKHHLIDVAEADSGFNAPRFQALANSAIKDISARGKLPILVGGTGLYIDSVLYDFGFLPNLGPNERAKLDNMDLKNLIKLAKTRRIDLSGVDTRNKRRVVRAIEAGGEKPTRKTLRGNTLVVGIRPSTKKLNSELKRRVEKMIETGLEQEVKGLCEKYGWEIEPMKGIGYKEWRPYFGREQSLDEVKARIVKNTSDLAKRQITWFKRNSDINWFGTGEDAYAFLTKHL